MSAPKQTSGSKAQEFGVHEVLYILFRHKWKIAACALLGIAAAAAYYLSQPPAYESEARLLVRYVVERSAVDSLGEEGAPGGRNSGPVMASEVAILSSWDLALDVASKLGPANILPNDPNPTRENAAAAIMEDLRIHSAEKSNVIAIVFRNSNPVLAREVPSLLVRAYFDKHLTVHRSLGAFDFVSQQTEQVRDRLRATEQELVALKARAGIVSVSDSTVAMTGLLASTQQELLAAEAAAAEQQARVEALNRETPPPEIVQASTRANSGASTKSTLRYQALVSRLAELRQEEFRLLERYTPTSPMVRRNRAEIQRLGEERESMEQNFPSLVGTADAAGVTTLRLDPAAERANLAAALARVEALREQLTTLNARSGSFSEISTLIAQLERRQAIEEENMKYLESSLEKARVDEALDPSKMPNISIVQAPSPAVRVTGESRKIVLGLAGGGLALGLTLAFLIELVVDRSVRRPFELETRLGIPQLVSIPLFSLRDRKSNANIGPDKAISLSSEDVNFAKPFSDAIRDRLISFFESASMSHKPKLIGVTANCHGAGVTTLASGLAASLSETGDGKVLLIDAGGHRATALPFLAGNPAGTIEDALQSDGHAAGHPEGERLCLAAVDPGSRDGAQLPSTISRLLPRFRASEFDYIIFDMAPMNQTSPTQALAGLMDATLFVIEAGTSDPDSIRRNFQRLDGGRSNVFGIMNKVKNGVPTWIEPHA